MTVFVDSSALMAVVDADDLEHARALSIWEASVRNGDVLVCSSYVLLETFALVQRRLGLDAVPVLDEDIGLALTVEWVNEADHRAGVSAVLAAGRRQLSLVDCVSFQVMRRLGIRRAFAFDPHFADHGFECIPATA